MLLMLFLKILPAVSLKTTTFGYNFGIPVCQYRSRFLLFSFQHQRVDVHTFQTRANGFI